MSPSEYYAHARLFSAGLISKFGAMDINLLRGIGVLDETHYFFSSINFQAIITYLKLIYN